MKKQKGLIIISLIIIFVFGIGSLLYLKPVFLSINPFYTYEVGDDEEGEIYYEVYWKHSLIPTVKADVPKGWEVKTIVYSNVVNYATDTEESEKIVGDVSIEIYKNGGSMASLSAITDTGGAGGVYYHFPDSDPEVYESMLEASMEEDSLITVREIGEGEYTKINLLGLEVRRVNDVYVPNTNEKDTYYFTNSLDPVLFYFDNTGPSYEVYYNGVINSENISKFELRIDEANSPSEEDLLIVDSILDSMELR